jgi:hypothetical protein
MHCADVSCACPYSRSNHWLTNCWIALCGAKGVLQASLSPVLKEAHRHIPKLEVRTQPGLAMPRTCLPPFQVEFWMFRARKQSPRSAGLTVAHSPCFCLQIHPSLFHLVLTSLKFCPIRMPSLQGWAGTPRNSVHTLCDAL